MMKIVIRKIRLNAKKNSIWKSEWYLRYIFSGEAQKSRRRDLNSITGNEQHKRNKTFHEI